MDGDLLETLWKAPIQAIDESVWKTIISGLFDDFEHFIGEEVERDSEMTIDIQHRQFSAWMWSKNDSNKMIGSVLWSGVIAGSLAKDDNGKVTFVVTADVFLFHRANQERLVTNQGKHFIQFHFEQSDASQGKWRCLGWVKDEWKEWEDVSYSIE